MEINWLWISAVNGAVLLALLGIVIGIRRGASRKWKDQFAQFDDAVRSAEMSNAAYFRSLEQMLKNLEFVRALTEQTEQRLAGIVARPGTERDGRFETAALLLSSGEKPAKVASMLNLPLSQVKRAREPQKASAKGRKAAQKIVAEQGTAESKGHMSLWSARVKKLFPKTESSEIAGNDHGTNGQSGPNGTAGS
jgi:hypothetical protein